MLAPEQLNYEWDMADFTFCPYSKREVVEAGKVLAGVIPDNAEGRALAVDVFKIAHSWRAASVYPMKRVRYELVGKLRGSQVGGISAARLKRMVSVRKKLRTTHFSLYQMQDIGGCRAIIGGIDELNTIVGRYLDGATRHQIVRDYNHIAEPKAATGYRSRHLVLKFDDPEGDKGYNRHFVEVQFRTLTQHTWATAVESIGLIRGEDLKGGDGNADWLRLFKIMAAEFAEDENCPMVAGVSENAEERRQELKDLNRRLHALETLKSCNKAIKNTQSYLGTTAPYYLIQYDTLNKTVSVKPYRGANAGSDAYEVAERNSRINSVLVDVDKVSDLREAYPNYFLDVEAFTARLNSAIHKQKASQISDWLRAWVANNSLKMK